MDEEGRPSHPDHADIVEWLDGYDPDHFEDIQLKYAVSRIASRRRAAKGPRKKSATQT